MSNSDAVENVAGVGEQEEANIAVETGLVANEQPLEIEKNESSAVETAPPKHPPSLFTDHRGNLKFVNLVCRRPGLVLFLLLTACFVVSYLLVKLVFAGGNPFADPADQYEMDDERSIAYDSLRLSRTEVQKQQAKNSLSTVSDEAAVVTKTQEENVDVTYWVFESEVETGVFGTPEAIKQLRDVETLFTEHEGYSDYCMKAYEDGSEKGKCLPMYSALNMYYASEWDHDLADRIMEQLSDPASVDRYNMMGVCIEFGLYCNRLPPTLGFYDYAWARKLSEDMKNITSKWDGQGEVNEDLDQVSRFAAHMAQLTTKKGLVDFFFDKDFSLENPISMHSRFIVPWGGPLNITSEDADSDKEDEESMTPEEKAEAKEDEDREALKKYVVKNMLPTMTEVSDPDYSEDVNSYYFMGALILEVLLDIVSKDAMLAIISFLFVFFYIRLMVGSWFLGFVGMTQIVFSIPISWFIFTVAFQIEYFSFLNALCLFIVAAIGADDIFIFMDAYKHSAFQSPEILVDLETRMSWVYRRTGEAMAITSATTCSAFLCTLITPLVGVRAFGIFAAIVIFIDYVLVMSLFCTAVVIFHNRFERPGCFASCRNCCRAIDPNPTVQAHINAMSKSSLEDAYKGEDRISRFFRTVMAPLLFKPAARAGIFLLFLGWIVTAGIFASKLEPTKQTEQYLDSEHPLQKTFTILNKAFPTAEEDINSLIYFAWGVDEVDRTGVNQLTKPDFYGEPRFYEDFRFDETCQTALLDSCDHLKTNTEYTGYIKQKQGLGSVNCFVEEFAAFSVMGNLFDCNAVKNGSWMSTNETGTPTPTEWQVDPDSQEYIELMSRFVQQRTCYPPADRPYQSIQEKYGNELGWNGESVQYAAISVENARIDPFSTMAQEIVMEQYDTYIDISETLDENVNPACNAPVLMTDLDQKFIFARKQAIYIQSAAQSASLGIAVAFTVLLISTKCLHIAGLATISISCVLVSVIGTTVMLGWSLGVIEAIMISIVAGFSVDYVVHLAHAYERAEGDTKQRIVAAFSEMGISVLSGMVTSIGASIPLFLCQLQFFAKFGTFLCLTIAFSWVFANFVFMSTLVQLKIPIRRGCGGWSL